MTAKTLVLPLIIDCTKATLAAHSGQVLRDSAGELIAEFPLSEGLNDDGRFSWAPRLQRAINNHDQLVAALAEIETICADTSANRRWRMRARLATALAAAKAALERNDCR